MKKLAVATITATLLAAAPGQAATFFQDFQVKVTLDSKCRMDALSPVSPVLQFGTYTAFGATQSAPTTFIKFECTRSLAAPSFDIDGTTLVVNTPIYGVVAGLNYSVTPTAISHITGTPASASTIGTGDTYTINLSGAMPDNQAGTAIAGEQSVTHRLTITY